MNRLTASVALCTYNGEKYVKEQLESIISQSRGVDEIIICDDMSTDSTLEIITNILKDCVIDYRIIVNEKRLGYSDNFQQAVLKCKGDVIFFCDQDDVWDNNKVFKVMQEFEKNDQCIMVYHDALLVDSELKIISDSSWKELNLDSDGFLGPKTSKIVFQRMLMYRWMIYGNAVAIKCELKKVYPIPKVMNEKLVNTMGSAAWTHDSWIAMNAPLYGEIVFLENKLIKYRQHGNNITGIKRKEWTSEEKTLDKIHHVLFNQSRHWARLQAFIEMKDNAISAEQKKFMIRYIKLFKRNCRYERTNKINKMIYLIRFCIFNEYKICNIGRKEWIIYILAQFK